MYYENQKKYWGTPVTSKIYRKERDRSQFSCDVELHRRHSKANQERQMAKKIVNIRLRPDQEERINAIVERSAILDTSKFVRIAVDWLLRSDIGQAIKEIVDDEAFPDYQIPKNPPPEKSAGDEICGGTGQLIPRLRFRDAL